jgi:hypothetical protein
VRLFRPSRSSRILVGFGGQLADAGWKFLALEPFDGLDQPAEIALGFDVPNVN